MKFQIRSIFTCLMLGFTTLGHTQTPLNNENLTLIVGEYSEDQFDEYKVYLDQGSIKKTEKTKRFFNLIVFGLDLDRSISYTEVSTAPNKPELNDMNNSRMVITNEINCLTKEIKPIKYLTLNLETGVKNEYLANKDDTAVPSTTKDQEIINKISELTCKQ